MDSLVHMLLSNAFGVTLMAAVAAGLAWAWRRPAVTHSLWLLVMLKLITPPLVSVAIPASDLISPTKVSLAPPLVELDARTTLSEEALPNLVDDESSQGEYDTRSFDATTLANDQPEFRIVAENERSSSPLESGQSATSGPGSAWRWQPVLLAIVMAGAVGWWLVATTRIIRFQRLLKHVEPVPGEWQSHANELASRLGLAKSPTVCLVPGRVPPMLWAIGGRPRLMMPSELWAKIGVDERSSLLLHELAHLKRHDHWVRWLEFVVVGLYWWHPVVWWARRALREAEEQCCDAWVVSVMPERARTYAAALLAAVEFVSGAPTAPAVASATSGSGHVFCLKRRLKMIVRAKTPKGLSWTGRIAVLGTAALVLPLAPSWAQNDKSTSTEPDRLVLVDGESAAQARQRQATEQEFDNTIEGRVAAELKKDLELEALKKQLERARERARPNITMSDGLIKSLQQQLAQLTGESELKRAQLRDLSKTKATKSRLDNEQIASKHKDVTLVQPTLKTASDSHVQQIMTEVDRNEVALIEAMSMLAVMRESYKERRRYGNQQSQQFGDAKLVSQIKDEFENDPDVIALKRKLDEASKHLKHIEKNVQQPHDAARAVAQRLLNKLQNEFSELRVSKFKEICSRFNTAELAEDVISLTKIQELEQKVDELMQQKVKLAESFNKIKASQKATKEDAFGPGYLNDQIQRLSDRAEIVNRNLEQIKYEASLDPARKQLTEMEARYENLRKSKHDQLLALRAKDDDKDDDKPEKARDVAERFQEQLKNLLDKVSKELSPVAEDVRKALETAVDDIHKSLEKEGLSADELGKALDKAQKDLRKAFEGGGTVDKDVREAIDKARTDLQAVVDRARGDLLNQVETLRGRSPESPDRAPEKDGFRDVEKEPNHDDVESTREEIRNLEQRLRKATRRLEQLEQRDSRRNSPSRREQRRPEPPRDGPKAPTVPAPPEPPVRPRFQRGRDLRRPSPDAMRRAPQTDTDKRFRELEEKMKLLLKELESLKDEKSSNDSKDQSPKKPVTPKPTASPITS